jgi:histidine triad (HIT) family protein
MIGDLVLTAKRIAREKAVEESGYRMVINCNKDAGQEVFHLHLHLLGGRKFTWPPG